MRSLLQGVESSTSKTTSCELRRESPWYGGSEHSAPVQPQWAGIIGNCLVGPVVLPQCLTDEAYMHFLKVTLPPLLEEEHLVVQSVTRLLHNSDPAHFSALPCGCILKSFSVDGLDNMDQLHGPPGRWTLTL
ncbi:hypothetical protein PR048_010952 [Dryococelus australis]|uniref:Uncharacterized protein n=1 Tax=Dryococelus australis TaxID=614101 RepID=A0ABQ9HKA1_9NEOP|nr:hypothetical protein PR048_010952 [Dryococelus australis]